MQDILQLIDHILVKYGLLEGILIFLIAALYLNRNKIKLSEVKHLYILYRNKKNKRLTEENIILQSENVQLKEELKYLVISNKRDVKIQNILNRHRDRLNLRYISIYEYHNGINNLASDSMLKYTMTYTSFHPKGFDTRNDNRNQSLTRFSELIEVMLKKGYWDSTEISTSASRTYLDHLGSDKALAVFLNTSEGDMFGSLAFSLSNRDIIDNIDYLSEINDIKKELESVYSRYRDDMIEYKKLQEIRIATQ